MRGTVAKKIRKMVNAFDPELLGTIRTMYGEKTRTMDKKCIGKVAKKLYKKGMVNISNLGGK